MAKDKKSTACCHAMLLETYPVGLATKEQPANIWIFQQVITHIGIAVSPEPDITNVSKGKALLRICST